MQIPVLPECFRLLAHARIGSCRSDGHDRRRGPTSRVSLSRGSRILAKCRASGQAQNFKSNGWYPLSTVSVSQ